MSTDRVIKEISSLNSNLVKNPRCVLASILQKLDDEQRQGVEAAMGDPDIQGSAIARWLQAKGYTISDSSVRYCRRSCTCWRH